MGNKYRMPPLVMVVRGIGLDHENKFPILRRSKSDSRYPESWELPGGKLEEYETLNGGLRREFKEETGWCVEALSLLVYDESRPMERKGNQFDECLYVLRVAVVQRIGGELELPSVGPGEKSEHDRIEMVTYQEALEYDLVDESRRALVALRPVLESLKVPVGSQEAA